MNFSEKTLLPKIDGVLSAADKPLTSREIADAVLSRPKEPTEDWEWFAIDGVLANMIVSKESHGTQPRGKRTAWAWRRRGVWLYCHVTKRFELGAGEDDTLERAERALQAARDDVLGQERTIKRGRPPKTRTADSVYTMALNY